MNNFRLKEVESMAYHRNGVGGNGFCVGIFKSTDKRRYLAIRGRDEDGINCFVLDLDLAADGNINFGANSWRGDVFSKEALEVVKKDPDMWADYSEFWGQK